MAQEAEDIFEIAQRILQVDLEARTKGSVNGEDAMWLTDRVRKLEQMLDDARAVKREMQAQNAALESQIDAIRRTHREWEEKLWRMNDVYRDALDQSETELEELNGTVQEVLRYHMLVEPRVAKSPNPEVRRTQESEALLANQSSAALVCRKGLSQLSEMSVTISERQSSGRLEDDFAEWEPPKEDPQPHLKRTHHMHYFMDEDLEEVPSLEELDFIQKAPTNPGTPEPLLGKGIIRVQHHKA